MLYFLHVCGLPSFFDFCILSRCADIFLLVICDGFPRVIILLPTRTIAHDPEHYAWNKKMACMSHFQPTCTRNFVPYGNIYRIRNSIQKSFLVEVLIS